MKQKKGVVTTGFMIIWLTIACQSNKTLSLPTSSSDTEVSDPYADTNLKTETDIETGAGTDIDSDYDTNKKTVHLETNTDSDIQKQSTDEIRDSDSVGECINGERNCESNFVVNCESGSWKIWDDCTIKGKICTVIKGLYKCVENGGIKVDNTDVNTDMNSDSNTDTDNEIDSDSDFDTNDADTSSDTDIDTDSDTDVDTDSDTDVDTDSDTDVDTDSDTDVDTDSDTDVDTDSDTDTDTDVDADADSDGDADSDTVIEENCDSKGNCYCLRMAIIGTANSDDESYVSEFADWLNNNSSCFVTMYNEKVELTESFLEKFDIIVFLYLSNEIGMNFWDFSSTEVVNLKTWVERGNGMVTLAGFNGIFSDAEVAAINSILKPVSGISYNADTYLSTGEGTCSDTNNCWCWGNTIPVFGWNAKHDISKNIQQIPILFGYSINAPANATVVATEPSQQSTTENAAVAVEVGDGKVFAWADEWVIYNSQWRDGDSTPGDTPDEYNVCYDMEKEQYNNAENYYQIPQFWYNVIKWISPANDCFIINDPAIII